MSSLADGEWASGDTSPRRRRCASRGAASIAIQKLSLSLLFLG